MPEENLIALKEEADKLEIQYHPSIGFDKLKEKVDAVKKPVVVETKAQIRARQVKEAKRLVRVRITCMSTTRKGWKGDWFTIMNSTFGPLKKYVPFDVVTHLPVAILKMVKRKQRQEFYDVPGKFGQKNKKTRMVPMFAVEELPNLTIDKLKELATHQAVNRSIEV